MGVDKAFLEFDGEPLLVRTLRVVREACSAAKIVGDPEKFSKYGSVVADVFTGCGPLAGIHTALTHSSAELNLMVAVDMPFVSVELLSFLIGAAEKSEATVTVPRTKTGMQPLCAVYRREFVSAAEPALQAGKYKIDAAFADLAIRVIDEPELSAAGFSEKNFFNVNTPDDRRIAGGLSF